MELFSWILGTIILIVMYKWMTGGRIAEALKKLPGPPTVPVFGNLLSAMIPKEEYTNLIRNWDSKYGPIYRTWAGPVYPIVHVLKPEYAETILSSTKYIKKSRLYEFLHPWLGTGLLTSGGSKWFKHRKMITPTFHFKILDNFIDAFNDNSKILVERLKDKLTNGNELDIYPHITLCALDIICESAMGTKIHAQQQEHSPYVQNLYRLINMTIDRFTQLHSHIDFIYYNTPAGKEYMKTLQVIHNFTNKVIRERKESRLNSTNEEQVDEIGRKKKKAFLDLLLDVSENESVKLTDEEIREEVDTFMFEGHDTTTGAICWSLFLLGHHPEIQDQVYEELKEIFSDDPDRPITMKDLNEMKLLERCVKEALRIYPSVPVVIRELDEDLQLDNYLIPKGVAVVVQIYSLHRDPKHFPNPEEFNPDNFLPERVQNRHPYAYVPFSAGPRNCIGQKFALLEEKLVLASLLRKFKFQSLDKEEDLIYMFELILRSKNGIKLKITPRN